jgi:hypothetical protein
MFSGLSARGEADPVNLEGHFCIGGADRHDITDRQFPGRSSCVAAAA